MLNFIENIINNVQQINPPTRGGVRNQVNTLGLVFTNEQIMFYYDKEYKMQLRIFVTGMKQWTM